jgi:hypothetical protein
VPEIPKPPILLNSEFSIDPKLINPEIVNFLPESFLQKYEIKQGLLKFNITNTTQFPLEYMREKCPSLKANGDFTFISVDYAEARNFYFEIEGHMKQMYGRMDDPKFFQDSMIEFLTKTNIRAIFPPTVTRYVNLKGGLLSGIHFGAAISTVLKAKQLPVAARAAVYGDGFNIFATLYILGLGLSIASDLSGANLVGRTLGSTAVVLLKPFAVTQTVLNLATSKLEKLRLGYSAPITIANNLTAGPGLRITDITECKKAINKALSIFSE